MVGTGDGTVSLEFYLRYPDTAQETNTYPTKITTMTTSITAIAFIGSKPIQAASGMLSSVPMTGLRTAALIPFIRGGSSASLNPTGMADYTSTAITYFTSIRTPAALITGSALAALFSLAGQARLGRKGATSRLQGFVLLAYHILALVALVLSLNVVVTATATSNFLLLGTKNPMASSAFEFMKREVEYEFLLTRWSFPTGMLSFLGCIGCRCLLEFDLLKKERLRSALLVIFSMSSLFFHLLAFINQRLVCWPNLFMMTIDVCKMYFGRALTIRSPSELTSVATFIGAFGMVISLFRKSATVEIEAEDDTKLTSDAAPTTKPAAV
jgi:hypothetical protein